MASRGRSSDTNLVILLGRLREPGVLPDEPHISAKKEAGTYLADGPPVAYAAWLDWVRSFATIIDMEEDAPVLPAISPSP